MGRDGIPRARAGLLSATRAFPPTCRRSTRCWPGSRRPRPGTIGTPGWSLIGATTFPRRLTGGTAPAPYRACAAPARIGPTMRTACNGWREVLARRGVDALLLPRTDEHGSEYLPPDAERVAWLSGFTGSAAQVVVLADKAAVFSDGRYTVQLAAEVDEALFERRHSVEQPASRWIEEHLPEGGRLGYDPFLVRRGERERLEGRRRRAARSWPWPEPDRRGLDRPPPRPIGVPAGSTTAGPARAVSPSAPASPPRSPPRGPRRCS